MRIFGSDKLDSMLQKLGLEEGEAIAHSWVNKAIERAQGKVEARNFEIRKTLLRFDNVMNDQRKVVYEQRRDLMAATEVADTIKDMRREVIEDCVNGAIPADTYPEQWDIEGLENDVRRILGLDLPVTAWAAEEGMAEEEVLDRVLGAADGAMDRKETEFTPEVMRIAEKSLLLQVIDQKWRDHLLALDHLRQSVGLRSYAQRDPLREYQREAFNLFDDLLISVRESVTQLLMRVEIRSSAEMEAQRQEEARRRMQDSRGTPEMPSSARGGWRPMPASMRRVRQSDRNPADPSTWGRVGRNERCPCGSGRKYKQCHGRIAATAGQKTGATVS